MKRLCHWPGCKLSPIYVRKVRLASGKIKTQIRADGKHGLCSFHARALIESIRAVDRKENSRDWVLVETVRKGLILDSYNADSLGLRSLGRLRLKQRINGLLRVFDYQPFFFRSALPFRMLLLRHTMVLSYRFSVGVVPQPGIGPGCPEWARDCKSRLSASSSTGAQKALNVGTGGPSNRAVPTCSGPISAALNLFSYRSPWQRMNLRDSSDLFSGYLSCLGKSSIRQSIFLSSALTEGDHISIASQFLQHSVRSLHIYAAAFVVGLFPSMAESEQHVCDCSHVVWHFDPVAGQKVYRMKGDPGCQKCRGCGEVEACSKCAGAGMVPGSAICANCRGTGKVPFVRRAA